MAVSQLALVALLVAACAFRSSAADAPEAGEPTAGYVDNWWAWPARSSAVHEAAVVTAALPSLTDNSTSSVVGAAAGVSDLWGRRGERWTPAGRMMDFSYAGYMQGSAPLPTPKLTRSFRQFQRAGMSDTAALQAALAWAHKQPSSEWVVIGLPAGTIRLDRQLRIGRPRLVLRGEGSSKTVLRIDRPLSDIPGVPPPPRGYGYFADQAFIMVEGRYLRDGRLARGTGTARRGDRKLTVDDASRIKAGQMIALVLSDKKAALTKYLLNNRPLDPGRTTVNRYAVVRFITRVAAVRGKVLTLERTLPFDVRPEFLPEILPQSGSVHDVGIEGLTFGFAWAPYGGHHFEAGFNAVQFEEVYNCWARDIRINNPDSGFFISKSSGVQISGVRITQSKPRNPTRRASFGDAHWGVQNGGSSDVLVDGFDIQPNMLHAVGSDAFGMYAVFSNGKMRNGNLELHRALAHALFTNIDVGVGDHALQSGGPARSGPNTQAWTVFWNIRSGGPIPAPGANGVPSGSCAFGPDMTLVGLALRRGKLCPYWAYQSGAIAVPNLYEAMLALRAKSSRAVNATAA